MKYCPMHFEFSEEEKQTLDRAADIVEHLLSYLNEEEQGELYRQLYGDPDVLVGDLRNFCNAVDNTFPASLD